MQCLKISYKAGIRPFDRVDLQYVAKETGLTVNMDLNGPFRWTPLIQKVNQSDDFLKKMRYFQRLKVFEEFHQGELIDAFIFEALKNTDFDYYYDYICKENRYCPFYGIVDYLIYHKVNKFPIVPILRAQPNTGFTSFGKERDMSMGQPVSAGLWALTNTFANSKLTQVHIIQTDGNHWRLMQMNTDNKFRKTGLYYGQNEFSKIYEDYEMQRVVLGLIKYSLSQQAEKEVALKQIYDFVDERRYLTEGEAPKESKIFQFLPKKIRQFFF